MSRPGWSPVRPLRVETETPARPDPAVHRHRPAPPRPRAGRSTLDLCRDEWWGRGGRGAGADGGGGGGESASSVSATAAGSCKDRRQTETR